MRRRPNNKDQISLSSKTNYINENNTNNLYQKRLRSWNRTLTRLKSNHTSVTSLIMNNDVRPPYKSTIYTYPINITNNRSNILSHTVLSESLTTESAFYCPSISYTSIQTIGDLNNNHVTTLNIQNKKRQHSTLSCENLSSQLSQIKTFDMLPDPNYEKHININQSSINNNLQLTHYQSPTKRSRLSIDDSIITNHHSLNSPIFIDDDSTIDINQQLDQQESLSLSMNNDMLITNSNSMETAVKMIQPIVDIIFNAFEDQLKNIQTKTIESSISNYSSISSLEKISPHHFYPSIMIPHVSLKLSNRPIILHAVNINIQLTTKQYTTNTIVNENHHLQSISLTELKQKLISYILSNNLISNHKTNNNYQRKRLKLKRILQLAVFGVSVLCGYLLL
ncbi:unnamed protein product [Rotaria sordida]|uniref:Uncharacterized protein n=1 Tax=Rotaria sordida TaxID=392033 RepID=A0A813YB30_9BILA|nr:unnamed protein product [Rotaria sordida]